MKIVKIHKNYKPVQWLWCQYFSTFFIKQISKIMYISINKQLKGLKNSFGVLSWLHQ